MITMLLLNHLNPPNVRPWCLLYILTHLVHHKPSQVSWLVLSPFSKLVRPYFFHSGITPKKHFRLLKAKTAFFSQAILLVLAIRHQYLKPVQDLHLEK